MRSDSAAQALEGLGADVVLVDGPDIAKRIAQATGRAAIQLGLDAVGGAATAQLASALAGGGVAVAYAAMSGQAAQIGPRDSIFRAVSLQGFWLATWAQRAKPAQRAALYRQLLPLLSAGLIRTPITRLAKPEQAAEALAQAERYEGKLLFAFGARHPA